MLTESHKKGVLTESHKKGVREVCLLADDLRWVGKVLGARSNHFGALNRRISRKSCGGSVSVHEGRNK